MHMEIMNCKTGELFKTILNKKLVLITFKMVIVLTDKNVNIFIVILYIKMI
jgi:hypothetical protein